METDDRIAVAQPKIRAQKSKELFEYAGAAGGFLDRYGYPFCRGRIFDTVETDRGQYDNDTEIFWASGAAFFIKKKYWEEMGGFDADFFAHMEEIDLCWRLKNAGYRIMCAAKSEVYHVGGGTLNAESPYKTYLNFRNNLVMLIKNLSPAKAVLVVFLRLWLDLLSLIKFLTDGKLKNAWAISRAHRYLFLNLAKISRKMVRDTTRFNPTGYYRKSIVWQYFARGKKKFSDL
jgi:GT2 family glycosyltransferase